MKTSTRKLECISSGSLKRCYKKDANTVYLIPFNKNGMDDLQKEMAYLNFLKQHKLPVVDVRRKIEYQGKEGIQQQMLEGNTLVKPHLAETMRKVKHIENIGSQVEHIRSLLEKHNILVEDLQFMINKKGKLVIMDPLRVLKLYPPTQPNERGYWIDIIENKPETRMFSRKMVDFVTQLEDLQKCKEIVERKSSSSPPKETKKRKMTTTSRKTTTKARKTTTTRKLK
jgi:hypothetical protein